ncbi:F-box protein [Arachis hypogaea]|nr:F-box protein [Arachis hypogaea]
MEDFVAGHISPGDENDTVSSPPLQTQLNLYIQYPEDPYTISALFFFFFFHGSFIVHFLPLSSHRPLTPQPSPPSKMSVNDEGLILISLQCVNLTWLKLRGCREITEAGMAAVGENCKALKKLSCASCVIGIKGINAVISRCQGLEELFEIVNGQSFAPLMIGSKRLRSLKVIGCLGDWDDTLEKIGNLHSVLVDVHLEKIQVSDVGLVGLSKCLGLDTLHIVKTAECSNVGLNLVAKNCRMLRKLHVDGWRTNRIGDDGLIFVAKHCINLQELASIGIYPTSSSLEAIASKCKALERLALCGLNTVGDAEIECVANKCVALKKLCIKGCPISNVGIEALASGCPNLIKFKVRRCRKVTSMVVEWVHEHRESLAFSFDNSDYEALNASQIDHDHAANDVIHFTEKMRRWLLQQKHQMITMDWQC